MKITDVKTTLLSLPDLGGIQDAIDIDHPPCGKRTFRLILCTS